MLTPTSCRLAAPSPALERDDALDSSPARRTPVAPLPQHFGALVAGHFTAGPRVHYHHVALVFAADDTVVVDGSGRVRADPVGGGWLRRRARHRRHRARRAL